MEQFLQKRNILTREEENEIISMEKENLDTGGGKLDNFPPNNLHSDSKSGFKLNFVALPFAIYVHFTFVKGIVVMCAKCASGHGPVE